MKVVGITKTMFGRFAGAAARREGAAPWPLWGHRRTVPVDNRPPVPDDLVQPLGHADALEVRNRSARTPPHLAPPPCPRALPSSQLEQPPCQGRSSGAAADSSCAAAVSSARPPPPLARPKSTTARRRARPVWPAAARTTSRSARNSSAAGRRARPSGLTAARTISRSARNFPAAGRRVRPSRLTAARTTSGPRASPRLQATRRDHPG